MHGRGGGCRRATVRARRPPVRHHGPLPARRAGHSAPAATASTATASCGPARSGRCSTRCAQLGATVDAGDPAICCPPCCPGAGRLRRPPTSPSPGDVSSQFLSGLMVAAPRLPHGLRIDLTTPLVSRAVRDDDGTVMRAFGVEAEVGDVGEQAVRVPAGRYRARSQYRIEADASAASYFFAAAALYGGRVRVEGLGAVTSQGDAAFADVLGRMGCHRPPRRRLDRGGGPADGVLHGLEVDLADLSDTAPTLAAVAPFAVGPDPHDGHRVHPAQGVRPHRRRW